MAICACCGWQVQRAVLSAVAVRIGTNVLDRLREDAIFLPCPPVTRGREVTGEAMEHPLCQSRAAKAFLLHAQNALMEWIVAPTVNA